MADRLLLEVRKDESRPPVPRLAGRVRRREHADPGLVGHAGEPDLLEVVLALRPGGRLADLLDGGQQQADQDGDDRDHHQQLDQREGAAGRRCPAVPGEYLSVNSDHWSVALNG